MLNATIPIELAATVGRDSKDGAKKASSGFNKLGGVLLIFTGIISAYLSSQVGLASLVRSA